MADNADVRSLEQLEVLLERSKRFRAQILKELDSLLVEMRRLTNWIETDAHQYWQQELVKSQRRYVEAQDALTRCMSYVREDERKPCTEQKKRVKVTTERRALCEERLQTVKAAAGAWERNYRKNQGKFQHCRDIAESDLMVAVHHLSGQIERLREYAQLKSGVASSLTSTASTASTAAIEEADQNSADLSEQSPSSEEN